MKGLLLFLWMLLFLPALHIYGQGSGNAAKQRSFDQKALDDYRNNADYQYEGTPPHQNNLLGVIQQWISDFFHSVFSENDTINAWKFTFYALMILALAAIIFNLFGIDLRFLFKPKESTITQYTAEEENIHAMDIDTLIANARNSHQWKLSQRYLYIKALRMLADKELIKWKPGKTNMEYYYELKQLPMRMLFVEITSMFETAWYGEKNIEQEEYREQQLRFEAFYTLVKQSA